MISDPPFLLPALEIFRLTDVGKVSNQEDEVIRWTIPRFRQRTRQDEYVLLSPEFTFQRVKRCQLYAFPNGLTSAHTGGWMDVTCRIPSLPSDARVFLSMVNWEGREVLNTEAKKNSLRVYRCSQWILRRDLESRSKELLPRGQLRIVCRVVHPGERGQSREDRESGSGADVTSSVENCGSGSRTQNTKGSGANVTSSVENCGNGSRTQNTKDAEEDVTHPSGSYVCDSCKPSIKGLSNLCENYKDLYLHSKDTDFIIRVRSREFRVHRVILRARIPAFDAMLTHNMAENHEGVVSIEDCDPLTFNEFLLFVYSGRVENLSPDNACGLYVLAEKYALQDLKEICLSFMKSSLSIESICDVICLATTHGEAELLRLATDFFVSNAEEILVTVKWQQFLAENLTQGNELLLKTLKLGYTKTTTEGKRK